RSQPRPQEQSQPTQYIHHHHHQTGSGSQHQSSQSHQSSKSPILSLQQYQTRLPQQQQQQTSSLSGLGGDLPLVYQSYQPQMHLRYQSSSSGSSSTSSQSQPLKTILINNAPIQYEYSQRHQPSSSSSSTSGSGRDPNLPLLYSARNQLQQHQQQQFAPPPSSKLYAIEQPKPQPSVQSNGISGGGSVNLLVTPTPAPVTRSPIKYQQVSAYKKYQINPFLPSNKLPGSFTPLYGSSSGSSGPTHHILDESSEEEVNQPQPTYNSRPAPKPQTTYVLVKPSPEPNQLYYQEKPAGLRTPPSYKEKPASSPYLDELEIYKPIPKPVTIAKPSYLDDDQDEDDREYYKPKPVVHKPNYDHVFKPPVKPVAVPIPVAVEYSTPRPVPVHVEYSTPRPHPLIKDTYYVTTTAAPPQVTSTIRPKYSVRQKPHHYKPSSTKAPPPLRQHLTEKLQPADIRSPGPNYFDHFSDYKSYVQQTYQQQRPQPNYIPMSKPTKVTKLVPAPPPPEEPQVTYHKPARPIYHHKPSPRPATPTQIVDTASSSGSTSLADLLKKLQDSNHLPKTLTPDNIDNSIRTLVKILNNLKASQQVHQQPSQTYPDQDYQDYQPPAGAPPPKSKKPPKKPVVDDDESDSDSPPTGKAPPGPTSGRPGIDYPNLAEIPETSFSCKEQRYKGFFGDPETNCQVWHYCDLNGGKASFLCPNGTIFSQVALTCDWWFNVKCSTTAQLYVLNERLYKYILPFTPKFPEDYSGPLVDKYLAIKFQEMEEKMQKQRAKGKPVPMARPEAENDDLHGNKLEDNDNRYNQNQPHPIQYVTENSIDSGPSTAAALTATTPVTLEDINAEFERGGAPETSSPIVVTAPSSPGVEEETESGEDAAEGERVTAANPMVVLAESVPYYSGGSAGSEVAGSSVRPVQSLREVRIEVKNDGTSGHLTPDRGYDEERKRK
ncbi:hypothetical protein pipiens_016698, partial [Culex pipiens pipiens]